MLLATLDRVGRVVCLVTGTSLGIGYAVFDARPDDAALFWVTGHATHYYGDMWSLDAAYVYPPPLAQLAGLLPWPMFVVPWMVLVFASLWYATRFLSAPIVAVGLATLYFGHDSGSILASALVPSLVGNPQAVIAAAIVIGFRHPLAWSVVALTKIGPGIGLAWFLFRREWRSLAVAVGGTAGVALMSFFLAPTAWTDFMGFAFANYGTPSPLAVVPVPLPLRVGMSLALIIWGARSNRPWTVPIAAGWSSLALYQGSYLIIWAAAIPIWVSGRMQPHTPERADESTPDPREYPKSWASVRPEIRKSGRNPVGPMDSTRS